MTVCSKSGNVLLCSLLLPCKVSSALHTDIMKGLNQHFLPQPSVTVRWAYLLWQGQKADDAVTQYTVGLRKLTENCSHSKLEKGLCDKFVSGLREAIQWTVLPVPYTTSGILATTYSWGHTHKMKDSPAPSKDQQQYYRSHSDRLAQS